MDTLMARLTPHAAQRRLQRAWRWWIAQLRLCLPAPVQRWAAPRVHRLIVCPRNEAFTFWHESNGATRELTHGRRGVDPVAALPPGLRAPDTHRCLLVPAAHVLTRHVRLPLVAREQERDIMRFEIDRYTPFDADSVYYACREIQGSQEADTYEAALYVVPCSIADGWCERLERVGLPVGAIDVESDASTPRAPSGLGVNLLPPERRVHRRDPLRTLNVALMAMAAAGWVVAFEYPLHQRARVVAELEQEVAELRDAAARVDSLRQELSDARRNARRVLARRLEEPLISDVLLELTERLPDTVWLENLALGRGRVDLSGQADSAARIINLLESSPLLSDVSFRAPVTRNARTGADRFRIDADLQIHDPVN